MKSKHKNQGDVSIGSIFRSQWKRPLGSTTLDTFAKEREKHPLILKNPILLVIDVQNYFFDPESPAYLEGANKILLTIQKLVHRFVEKDLPVIGTVHSGSEFNMVRWWGNSVISEYALPLISEIPILKKSTYDAFEDTFLEEALIRNNCNQVFITGAMTHLCCETTARSAFIKGYEVIMVIDALVDKNESFHFYSLKNLAHGFAVIAESRELP